METAIELNKGDRKKYKVKVICDSAVYVRESESYLPGFYYLVSQKGYLKEENTWEPALAVLYFCKLISTFYCDHPEKPTTISPSIDSTSLMVKPTVKPTVKPKTDASSTK